MIGTASTAHMVSLAFLAMLCIVHNMSSAELIKLLRTHGWEVVSIRGSHHKMRNKDGRTLIIPHPKKNLGKGLVRAILRQAGL